MISKRSLRILIFAPFSAAYLALAGSAAASTEKILYSFTQTTGTLPQARLLLDATGNFYGTTDSGGTSDLGTVFKLAPDGTETVLHSFSGGSDGAYAMAALVAGKKGIFYSTTEGGGFSNAGTIYKITTNGVESVLYSFTGGSDGAYPYAELILDREGNLYGTTHDGGASGFGMVFELTPGGQFSVLHSFTGGNDGANPFGGLVMDADGNLYGTTSLGGLEGDGVLFKLAADGTETVLYFFGVTGFDARIPFATLIRDKTGNLFGTTTAGGVGGHGTVFKVTPAGAETVLTSFPKSDDGIEPFAGLVMDKAGNLYGTTAYGGTKNRGTIYQVTPDGTETVLYSFLKGADGATPHGALTLDKAGNFYGMTAFGGSTNWGSIFEFTP